MKLEAKIIITENVDAIAKLFAPEKKHFNRKRSTVTIKKNKNTLTFVIKATDSVALRATTNGITKLLTTFEQAEKV